MPSRDGSRCFSPRPETCHPKPSSLRRYSSGSFGDTSASGGRVQRIVKAGQQETQCGAAPEAGQGVSFDRRKGAPSVIARLQLPHGRTIQAALTVHGPRHLGYRQVVSQGVRACEVEVEDSGDPAVLHEDIVGEQVRMDCTDGQMVGPMPTEGIKFPRDASMQAGCEPVRILSDRSGKPPPAGGAEVIDPFRDEVRTGEMHVRQRPAYRPMGRRIRPAGKKSDDQDGMVRVVR